MSVAIRKRTPTGVSSGYENGIRILAARSRSVVAALTAVKGCHSLPLRSNPNFMRENKNNTQQGAVLFWLGYRDSNPNIQSQSLLCCQLHHSALFCFVKIFLL